MTHRSLLVISDTHIGAGGRAEGNRLEDFISDAEFSAWLSGLVAASQRDGIEMELVINGDWIEFLQIPAVVGFEPGQPYPPAFYSNPGEAEAVQRLEICWLRHPGVFRSLADFVHAGFPRRSLTILFGNHDPELVYPAVQTRLAEMLGLAGGAADLLAVGERSYLKDGVYIEHGNAYTEAVNRFADPDAPWDPDKPAQVERPVGSKFVTNFFNGLEWERPWVDGVFPISTLIFFAIAYEPAYAVRLLQALLAAAPDILTRSEDEPGVLAGPATEAVRRQIADPAAAAALVRRLQTDPALVAVFTRQVQAALIEQGMEPPDDELAAALADLSPAERARVVEEQYWAQLEGAADEIARATGARVLLFGHIHARIEKTLPSGALYLNTGTWIWQGDFRHADDATWQDLIHHPEKYADARDLTFARIDFDADGQITTARLDRAGPAPTPPAPPGPAARPGLFTRLLLSIRSFFLSIFVRVRR
jgi:UDP-2,3-diacylglucosamine pyrophosphatase LpxH